MISVVAGLEILGMIGGAVYLVSKVEANTKANKEALEVATRINQDAIAQLANQIGKNMEGMKELLQINKEQQRDVLNREISHIKDLISISNTEMREDIKRLEQEQKKSNEARDRLALIAASVRSLHKRLDLDPSLIDKVVED